MLETVWSCSHTYCVARTAMHGVELCWYFFIGIYSSRNSKHNNKTATTVTNTSTVSVPVEQVVLFNIL